MALPEYKNLTQSELDQADHYAEIGDGAALRAFQRLSASREGKHPDKLNSDAYNNPMRPVKT